MNIAILGAGVIAAKMAATVNGMGPDFTLYAVASRSMEKARAFAGRHRVLHAYGSYEEMLEDPHIDLVYVATPHSHHYAHARLCLEHGKSVLCEKAFTQNAAQAESLFALAKEKRLLLTEAIWTRYMPSRKLLNDLLAAGAVGTPRMLSADFGHPIEGSARMADPALAGGALLDLGVYPLNFALMAFGDDLANVTGTAVLTGRGVDAQDAITLTYKDGRAAALFCTMRARADNRGVVMGDKGYLETDDISNIHAIAVCGPDGRETARYDVPAQITGYEYEVEACARALKAGALECPEMPHAETLRVMRILDNLRASFGVRYPGE